MQLLEAKLKDVAHSIVIDLASDINFNKALNNQSLHCKWMGVIAQVAIGWLLDFYRIRIPRLPQALQKLFLIHTLTIARIYTADIKQIKRGRMVVKVIGLIELTDQGAFEQYRSQVGKTVELYKGSIAHRGAVTEVFWNELSCQPFSAFVELHFPSKEDAHAWAHSSEYQSLVAIRNQAMKLTLFGVTI
jgi:uncharacterized protein (DUF1330 family)